MPLSRERRLMMLTAYWATVSGDCVACRRRAYCAGNLWRALSLLLMVILSSALLFAQQTAPLRLGVLVKPDTVQVGDAFVMTVSVEIPAGARITWPTPADSNGPIGLRAPIRVTGNENGAVRKETAEYSLAAW
ncbi:MAG: hypothetical protein M3Y64_08385, partial [Gemmatimonadota bacterium]|nr:hypothetical protein [Gemmatimonadota bacterium]